MSLSGLIDTFGDQNTLALGGAAIGLLFGIFAQRSRYCFRATLGEIRQGLWSERVAVWLFAFAVALIGTQALIMAGQFETGTVRQLNSVGSLSGAIIGGVIFGCGMALARACASRILVLSVTGNLPALLAMIVFAVTAQSARTGFLAPLRTALGDAWTIEAHSRDLLALFKIGHTGGLLFAGFCLGLVIVIAKRRDVSRGLWIIGGGVGATIPAAWWFNYAASTLSFETVPVHSISFTNPSSDLLMYALSPAGMPLTFDLGLIPGVVAGALAAAVWSGEMAWQGFANTAEVARAIIGGGLMGFGGILAGGCVIGAGVTGASVFTVTAWVVLAAMAAGALATASVIDPLPVSTREGSDAVL